MGSILEEGGDIYIYIYIWVCWSEIIILIFYYCDRTLSFFPHKNEGILY